MRVPGEILTRIKNELQNLYGDRLKGVILYGSEARGEAEDDSDIDLLVLLEPPVSLWWDIKKIVHAIYPIQLEVLRPIHAAPANVHDYEGGVFALYRNVRAEGFPI